MTAINLPAGKGVRKLALEDIAPDAEILIHEPVYDLKEIVRGKSVIDIGCGYGRNKAIVEAAGGTWVGVEPFEGGGHTVVGDAENLPFGNGIFDIAIMDAVLEHIPDVGKAFSEVSRVLVPGGLFVGYSAYMECFHEISYSHLSYMALQHYALINNMRLVKISGGGRFGIDYHLNVILYPFPFKYFRPVVALMIRSLFRVKSWFVYAAMRFIRKKGHIESAKKATLYYKVECLRQSNGFSFVIQKNDLATQV
jgi:SAM-dependent methyltransferase